MEDALDHKVSAQHEGDAPLADTQPVDWLPPVRVKPLDIQRMLPPGGIFRKGAQGRLEATPDGGVHRAQRRRSLAWAKDDPHRSSKST